ncbi:hypothetical protein QBC43DRAFT_38352 [Cladorrhinum sp. PSN259]|nr:hypothetical protein QBC43DRAFT_38352 [Cladorrhinum sp. PSN259]
MRSALALTALVAVARAQVTAAPSIPTVSGCPAVLSVTALCNTCVTLACIETAYITAGCDGCPSAPATVFTGYPCEDNCAGLGGCKTEYMVVSAADPGECKSEPQTISLDPIITGSGSENPSTIGVTVTEPGDGISITTVTTTGGTGSAPAPTQTTLSGTVSSSVSSTAGPVSTNAAGRLRPWRLW